MTSTDYTGELGSQQSTEHTFISHRNGQSSTTAEERNSRVNEILQSEIGVAALLTRLKHVTSTCKDFAVFLKRRAILEDDQAQGMRKLCKATNESLRRPDSRQGSYAQQLEQMIHLHDRLAENGIGFSLALNQMHDDLAELANNMERGRKQWKQFGLNSERKAHDAEQMVEKAKAKYDSYAEEYDRVRTGDRRAVKSFGFKASRSGVQHEEELHRRVTAAGSDYESKVQIAKAQRQELSSSLRPQAVHALREMVDECDSGMTVQLQKYAQLNEKFILSNGLTINPFKDHTESRSLRDIVSLIDNGKDIESFLISFSSGKSIGTKEADIKFQRHPSLTPQQQIPVSQPAFQNPPLVVGHDVIPNAAHVPPTPREVIQVEQQPRQDFPVQSQGFGAIVQQPVTLPTAVQHGQPLAKRRMSQDSLADLPRLRPVFGVPLDELLARDDCSIPVIVCQCVQAVDLYGLDVEGIYRLSGERRHMERIRAMFDNDASCLDFRRAEDFFHDVNSVASILKQYLRDLPEPLLTNGLYHEFITASKIDDDIIRRDSLHGLINRLPDSNYATLRLLALHLHRVQEHSNMNRMSPGNLAICFGPTLMGSNSNPNIADANWQVRAVETILLNCFSIFHNE